MFDGIRNLVVEQRSPAEVIIFILVGVIVCMALAIIAYVAIMFVIWAVYLRKEVSLARVLLPSGKQIRDYFGEYALAVSTSVLLALTVGAKHDLVQTILETDLSDVVQIGVESPFADELEQTGSLLLSNYIVQPIANGASEDATLFIRDVVLPGIEREGLARWITERNLLLACIVLSVLYILWLALHRSQEPKASPKYGRTLKGVFVMAICVTLLLVSPSLLADEHLAESAVAVLRESDPPGERVDQQRRLVDLMHDAQAGTLAASMTSLQMRVAELVSNLEGLSASHRSDIEGLTEMLGEVVAADDRAGDLERALVELTDQHQQLSDRHERLLQQHIADLEDFTSQVLDGAEIERLTEQLASLANQHRELQIRHQEDIASLRNRQEPASTDDATLIVHADRTATYVFLGERQTGPRCFELNPGVYPIRAGRAQVYGSDGSRMSEVRIDAGDVKSIWIEPGRATREPPSIDRGPGRNETPPRTEECPDLVVDSIKPRWDGREKVSIIEVEIRNAGDATAAASLARLVDPSTMQDSGEPHSAVTRVPSLAPGGSTTVTFQLPYWVFNPDALLEVTADFNKVVSECDEQNNDKRYEAGG